MKSNLEWPYFLITDDLSAQLILLLNHKDMTLARIAMEAGLRRHEVIRILNGQDHVTIKRLVRIVTALGGQLEIKGGKYHAIDRYGFKI